MKKEKTITIRIEEDLNKEIEFLIDYWTIPFAKKPTKSEIIRIAIDNLYYEQKNNIPIRMKLNLLSDKLDSS